MALAYVIIDAGDVASVDFSEVLETSEETLRWSLDGSKTFVKFPSSEETPSFLEGKTQFDFVEIQSILDTSEWNNPNNSG